MLKSNIIAGNYEGAAFETLTVSSNAVGFTSATYTLTGRTVARAVIYCEDADVRYTWDGSTDPVGGTTGLLLADTGALEITGPSNIGNFKAIMNASTAANLQVMYEYS